MRPNRPSARWEYIRPKRPPILALQAGVSWRGPIGQKYLTDARREDKPPTHRAHALLVGQSQADFPARV